MACGPGVLRPPTGRRRRLRAAAWIAIVIAPVQAAAALECSTDPAAPAAFRLKYDVHASRGMLAMTGRNELRFERDGDRYTLVSETSAPPLYAARQTSRGTVSAQGLVPHEYAEIRTRRAEMKVTFDWDGREVALGGSGTRAPTVPQLQDRLTLLLEVSRLMRDGQPRDVRVMVAGVRRIEPYVFATGAREAIDVPAGRFEALRIERTAGAGAGGATPAGKPDAKGDGEGSHEREDRLELWLAPALCGLPVRIRYRDEHGLVVENTLKSAEPGR
jgi:hypothetical protein